MSATEHHRSEHAAPSPPDLLPAPAVPDVDEDTEWYMPALSFDQGDAPDEAYAAADEYIEIPRGG